MHCSMYGAIFPSCNTQPVNTSVSETDSETNQQQRHDYSGLTPDVMIAAIESTGLLLSGRTLALNSYENRVYRCDLEQGGAVVAKFYRPQRWTDAAILEEHAFALQLAARDVPVVAPMSMQDSSLLHYAGYRFALYPVQGGRWPELAAREDFNWMGRFIARIHQVGATAHFEHRQSIDIDRMAVVPSQYLLDEGFIPAHIEQAYSTLIDDLLSEIHAAFARCGDYKKLRLHGDCHRGNVLWTDDGPHFVDLDDCCSGPAIQDLWMLLSGDRNEMSAQMCDLLEGYEEFAELDLRELHLIEALRTLRIIHYASWLAKRWSDPAFPQAFPWFDSNAYWEEHVLELREQFSRLREPVLVV